jgi:hypothetical protein
MTSPPARCSVAKHEQPVSAQSGGTQNKASSSRQARQEKIRGASIQAVRRGSRMDAK